MSNIKIIRRYFAALTLGCMSLFLLSPNLSLAAEKNPAPVVKTTPAPVVKATPAPVANTTPAPVAAATPAPVSPTQAPNASANPTPASATVAGSQAIQATQQPETLVGKVIHVEPIYTTKLVPHRACRVERHTMVVPVHRAVDGSGMVVGGIAGGVIGNRFGRGTGNIAATIGGAVLGSVLGNNVEQEMNRPYVQYVYVRVCHTKKVKESYLKGYNVTYSVNGKTQTTFMKKKPDSDQIRLELVPVNS